MHVELQQVSKRFGRHLALHNVSLHFRSGLRVALIGPNGSGKSTLIRALMGLVACEGSVRLDGHDALQERAAIAKRLAYVPQIAPQMSAPVGEVLAAVAQLRAVPVSAFQDILTRLALDLAPIAARPLRDLSGGMKQKLLIALALGALHKVPAPLLILDEPSASLDADTRERFFALLDEKASQATVLLCSHRREEIQERVDRLVSLADGEVCYDGAP